MPRAFVPTSSFQQRHRGYSQVYLRLHHEVRVRYQEGPFQKYSFGWWLHHVRRYEGQDEKGNLGTGPIPHAA
jgi:hypothetical protein